MPIQATQQADAPPSVEPVQPALPPVTKIVREISPVLIEVPLAATERNLLQLSAAGFLNLGLDVARSYPGGIHTRSSSNHFQCARSPP